MDFTDIGVVHNEAEFETMGTDRIDQKWLSNLADPESSRGPQLESLRRAGPLDHQEPSPASHRSATFELK